MAELHMLPNRHLNELHNDLIDVIEKYAGRVTFAEGIGILEMVKLELYDMVDE